MKHFPLCLSLAVSLVLLAQPGLAVTVTLDFEELPLDSQDFYNGADGAGGFASGGAWFNNQNSGSWMGWSYSRTTNTTTPGPLNQYSAYTGSGFGNSEKYAVAFNGLDGGFGILPIITLPDGAEPQRVQVTNTTYAALSMLHGDPPGGFAKKFGGTSGNDPDYFRLWIEGLDANDQVIDPNTVVDLYLADFRFSNPSEDYILDQWTELDLTPLAGLGVEKLAFRLESTDNSIFGMNTPAYVAIDNLELDVTATPGDFDLNGTVDSQDLATWQENYGSSSGVTFADGDADENRVVDARDFILWQRNTGPAEIAITSLPEPSSLLLSVLLIVLSNLNSRTALAKKL